MQVDFPLHIDVAGRTGTTDDDDHIHDLIEQVLFTVPGERVNRPTFGSGLARLVFDPNSHDLATATQLLVQGSLQQWLGDRIRVEDATVVAEDSILHVTVTYTRVRDGAQQVASFSSSTG